MGRGPAPERQNRGLRTGLWADAPSLKARHPPGCFLILNPTKIPYIWVCSLCHSYESQTSGAHSTLRTLLVPIPRRLCIGSRSPEAHEMCPRPSASFSPSAAHREAASKNRHHMGVSWSSCAGFGVLMTSWMCPCWCFRLSGAARHRARTCGNPDTRSPGLCLCCRLTGLLFFMCSDSR